MSDQGAQQLADAHLAAATVGQRNLFELIKSLMLARKNFDPSASDHGRRAVCQVLLAMITFVSETIPDRLDLPQPLQETLFALRDLDRGRVSSLLEPTLIDHRPPMPYSEELFRADAAILMELKKRSGIKRMVAAEIVARRLNERGYRDGNDRLAGKKIAAWRDVARQEIGVSDLGRQRYRFVLERLEARFPGDPEGAFAFYLDVMLDLHFPDILKKPHS